MGRRGSTYLLVLSFLLQSLLNLWWVYHPGKISPFWLVGGNILLGCTWLSLLAVWVVRLVRGKPEKGVTREFRVGHPIVSLVASIIFANVIGFWLCDFRLCFFILYLNLAVPVVWFVARKVLQRQIAKELSNAP